MDNNIVAEIVRCAIVIAGIWGLVSIVTLIIVIALFVYMIKKD